MHKQLLLVVIFLGISFLAKSQYYVSHIQGPTKRMSNQQFLKIGDTINLTEKLIFKNKKDFITVISPVKGSYSISGNKATPGKVPSEFIAAVSELLIPANKINTMAIRSGLINTLYDFETYIKNFSDSNRFLILDSRKINLNISGFESRDSRFFFIRYRLNNEDINKRLLFQEPTKKNDSLFLVFGKYLYEVDGKPVDVNLIDTVQVYYYQTLEKKSTFLSSFRINYCTQSTLLNELSIVRKTIEAKDPLESNKKNLIITGIRDHIYNSWGSIEQSKFEAITKILNLQ